MGSRAFDKFGRGGLHRRYYGWRDGFGVEDHGDLTPPPTRIVDRYSDGMYGWVKVTDGERTVRVSWQVDGRIDTPDRALAEAERQLRGAA